MNFESATDGARPGILRLRGELDLAAAAVFEAAAAPVIAATGTLTLDLAGLDFLDSTGLATMVKLHRAARDGGLVLVDPQPQVLRVLEVTGLDKVFRVVGG